MRSLALIKKLWRNLAALGRWAYREYPAKAAKTDIPAEAHDRLVGRCGQSGNGAGIAVSGLSFIGR